MIEHNRYREQGCPTGYECDVWSQQSNDWTQYGGMWITFWSCCSKLEEWFVYTFSISHTGWALIGVTPCVLFSMPNMVDQLPIALTNSPNW